MGHYMMLTFTEGVGRVATIGGHGAHVTLFHRQSHEGTRNGHEGNPNVGLAGMS
jgi:hypothetical protein